MQIFAMTTQQSTTLCTDLTGVKIKILISGTMTRNGNQSQLSQSRKEDKRKEEDKAALGVPDNAPTWDDFTRKTTFHGVKYVFDQKPMRMRRSITLFTFQVIDRTNDYRQHNINVNVEVRYLKTLPFPTVKICNQNTYRITATVEHWMYEFIDEAYTEEDLSDEFNLRNQDLNSHNYTEFVLNTALQREDFIDSCIWKGNKCNISKDFTTTVTEFGVCFTFSTKEEVSHAGAGFALSLVLNIEQYEYMKGSQDEAGIKMLLHDTADVALVKELGFAIAPGTHTLVGVNREVVDTLTHPYGTCDSDARPRSHCITYCRTEKIIEKCGCRDVLMPPIRNAEICYMSQAFSCVLTGLNDLTKEENHCEYPVPCRQINYEPDLSYAHLSKLNVDRISLNVETKLKSVQESYEQARELSQRVNKVVADWDAEWLKGLLNDSNHYSVD